MYFRQCCLIINCILNTKLHTFSAANISPTYLHPIGIRTVSPSNCHGQIITLICLLSARLLGLMVKSFPPLSFNTLETVTYLVYRTGCKETSVCVWIGAALTNEECSLTLLFSSDGWLSIAGILSKRQRPNSRPQRDFRSCDRTQTNCSRTKTKPVPLMLPSWEALW